jgi:hypothetical protein
MSKLKTDDLAYFAYRAYGEATGGLNSLGDPIPVWEDLPENTRQAWRATTEALSVHVVMSVAAVEAADVLVMRADSHRLLELRCYGRQPETGIVKWELFTEPVSD